MTSLREEVFTFSNTLTRSLELLDKTDNNTLVLAEILAHIGTCRKLAPECGTVLASLRASSGKKQERCFRMLLALYHLFPDLACAGAVNRQLLPFPTERLTFILLLKCAASVIEAGGALDITLVLDACEEQSFRHDTEIDYLFLQLLLVLRAKNRLMPEVITQLQKSLDGYHPPLQLAPKLIVLAAQTALQYQAPVDALCTGNRALFIRVMDAFSLAGSVCEKERLLEIAPKETQAFISAFKQFVSKEISGTDVLTVPPGKKALLQMPSLLERVKEVVGGGQSFEKAVLEIRRLLGVPAAMKR
ncbi:hypothetical protein NEDG_01617 [Nematocida displodere]|uniref:Uncharacterized protein n=1 Tax=Nematocida displodere TaxID=1805483 RepID=A0A177EGV8_9MICR|nr:hypothetical protein NEDG_01617 [Nematocida displodere]